MSSSMTVPLDTTLTTSLSTSPLDVAGSLSCSQMATRYPFSISLHVVVDRVIRHAAHRSTLFESAISACKRQIEHSRSSDGIVEKHLVKVAEAEEKQTIGIIIFYLKISLHHRREFVFVDIHFSSLCPKSDADFDSVILTSKNLPISSLPPSKVTKRPPSSLPQTMPSSLGATSSQSTLYTPPM